ncbi:MAG: hypothetical protein U0Q16_33350 [Bryobacteraceae bacterium]
MSTVNQRELLEKELALLGELDVERVLAFVREIREEAEDRHVLLRAAESSFSKDWFSEEEDAIWAHL